MKLGLIVLSLMVSGSAFADQIFVCSRFPNSPRGVLTVNSTQQTARFVDGARNESFESLIGDDTTQGSVQKGPVLVLDATQLNQMGDQVRFDSRSLQAVVITDQQSSSGTGVCTPR